MPKNKRESFWKKYHIERWILVITLAIAIVALIPQLSSIWFRITGIPSVSSTYEGCLVNKDALQTFLTNNCNKLMVGETSNFTNADFPSNVLTTETENLNVRINRATIDYCTAVANCSYVVSINDVLTLHTCVSVCVTRAKTNKTECQTTC